jgi:hypothetical protein
MRNAYNILDGKTKERQHLRDVGVKRRIILKRILEKWGVMGGLDYTDSGQCIMARFCEHGDEPSGSIKLEFLQQVSNYQEKYHQKKKSCS